MKPIELINLEEAFHSIDSVGKKSSQKMAFNIIESKGKAIDNLINALKESKANLIHCFECGVITNQEICNICSNPNREPILMITTNSFDLWHIEQMGVFNGKYHVLNGEINPSKKINPEDLNIARMPDRIKNFNEVIISTNPTVYGEITAGFIVNLIKGANVKITRLASGIPMGANIDYIDNLTFKLALKNRTKERDE